VAIIKERNQGVTLELKMSPRLYLSEARYPKNRNKELVPIDPSKYVKKSKFLPELRKEFLNREMINQKQILSLDDQSAEARIRLLILLEIKK
jgi:predicted transcriptional regulator